LILRRMSLAGDALSHAILPGPPSAIWSPAFCRR
jgi:ABC-type Mn2+/Zn2+ transport system permease subunit